MRRGTALEPTAVCACVCLAEPPRAPLWSGRVRACGGDTASQRYGHSASAAPSHGHGCLWATEFAVSFCTPNYKPNVKPNRIQIFSCSKIMLDYYSRTARAYTTA